MNEVEDNERGRKLLSAVERIIDDTENIIAVVDRHAEHARSEQPGIDEDVLRDLVSSKLVKHYSTSSAISGGATALPAIFPGAGSIIALTGGTLLDVAFILKFEVEMALALCWNYGFDVRDERERELAFLLASVLTHDESTGENFVNDVMKAETQALWNYAPRQVPKLIVQVLARLALRQAAKGLARALPFVGIAIGAGLNKALTTKTGNAMTEELRRRRAEGEHEQPKEDVVDANVVDSPATSEPQEEDIVDSVVVPEEEPVVEAVRDPDPAQTTPEPKPTPDPRAALEALSYNAIRAKAKELGIPARGKKTALVDAILAAQE